MGKDTVLIDTCSHDICWPMHNWSESYTKDVAATIVEFSSFITDF